MNVQLLLFRVLVCGFLLSPDLSVPPAQPSPIQPLSPPATSFQYITGKSDGPAMLNDPALQEERAGGHERDFFYPKQGVKIGISLYTYMVRNKD